MKSLSIILVLVISSVLHAQDAPEKLPPPPKFPLKLRAPENASWAMIVTPRKAAEAGAGESSQQQVSVQKTFPIYYETAAGKKSWQMWIFAGPICYRFMKTPDAPKWSRVQDTVYNQIPRYDRSDFPEAEWIAESNFQDARLLDGRPVYYFSLERDTPITRSDMSNIELVEDGESFRSLVHYSAYAWIDAKTLLPVKVVSGDEERTYTFGQPPSSRLNPPADVLSDLKQWVELNRRLSQ